MERQTHLETDFYLLNVLLFYTNSVNAKNMFYDHCYVWFNSV